MNFEADVHFVKYGDGVGSFHELLPLALLQQFAGLELIVLGLLLDVHVVAGNQFLYGCHPLVALPLHVYELAVVVPAHPAQEQPLLHREVQDYQVFEYEGHILTLLILLKVCQ